MSKNNIGYIYCLSNPAIPGKYKIGKSMYLPDIRAKQLYNTSLPYPFKVEFFKKVTNYHYKEKLIHKILESTNQRCNPKREFFALKKDIIFLYFELMDGIRVN